uniref:Uncharacterized protein n=1 Tax=Oryzias latipes TaxID=8090 RepID=A0A3P9IEG6_ORYLA
MSFKFSRTLGSLSGGCRNLIDPLCSLGVEKDLPLPAIAVIGDQGKSSVGEAPPRVALPRGRGDLSWPLVGKGWGPPG